MSKKVVNRNCSGLTVFLALPAADASRLAYIHKRLSFFVRITLHKCPLFIRDQLNQMFRTDGNTFPACLACLFIYFCDPVCYMDRVKGTRLHT